MDTRAQVCARVDGRGTVCIIRTVANQLALAAIGHGGAIRHHGAGISFTSEAEFRVALKKREGCEQTYLKKKRWSRMKSARRTPAIVDHHSSVLVFHRTSFFTAVFTRPFSEGYSGGVIVSFGLASF